MSHISIFNYTFVPSVDLYDIHEKKVRSENRLILPPGSHEMGDVKRQNTITASPKQSRITRSNRLMGMRVII